MQAVAELVQCEVGMLVEELPQFGVAFFGDSRGSSAGIGSWLQGTGLVTELQIAGDTVEGDAEEGSNCGQGAYTSINGIDDAAA